VRLRDLIDGLSSLVRTGWMQRGVPPSLGETVAEHSFAAALIALELGLRLREKGVVVNPERAAAIAVAHDAPEAVVGDLPKWTAGKLGRRKEELELMAIDDIREIRLLDYSKSYIEMSGREAVLAKVAEVLATLWKAEKYQDMGISRVAEIRRSMEDSLMKLLSELRRRDPPLAEALEEALGELA